MDKPIAIVTGSSSGIGRACAEELLLSGYRVFGCSIEAPQDPIGNDLYDHTVCDLSYPAEAESFLAGVVAVAGGLNALVNNAGTHPPPTPIDDIQNADFDYLVAVNLRSAFVLCREALPWLRRSQGAIVNMSSQVAQIGQEGAATYCLTKAGLSGLTRALAIDEAQHGVRVNCVSPGAILTPLARSVQSPESQEVIKSWSWMNRWGTAAEVAQVVTFLLSDRASYVTGQDIAVGGGAELGYGLKGDLYMEAMGGSANRVENS